MIIACHVCDLMRPRNPEASHLWLEPNMSPCSTRLLSTQECQNVCSRTWTGNHPPSNETCAAPMLVRVAGWTATQMVTLLRGTSGRRPALSVRFSPGLQRSVGLGIEERHCRVIPEPKDTYPSEDIARTALQSCRTACSINTDASLTRSAVQKTATCMFS